MSEAVFVSDQRRHYLVFNGFFFWVQLPDVASPAKLLGTSKGLTMALGGFSNTALALVGGALFLAAAMTKTGLDRRIALVILSKIGARTNRVLAGVIFVGFFLSFFCSQHDSARILYGTHCYGDYSSLRRGEKKPFCRYADDRHCPGGQHLECGH
jgi:hypothetical protein